MNIALPTPYYQDEYATIYHGDSRQIVPLLGAFDLLLTDPPYGLKESNKRALSRGRGGFTSQRNAKAAWARDYGDFDWDSNTPSGYLLDMLRDSTAHQIIFGGNYFHLPPSSCWLVWDKDNTGDFADCELAWTNLKKAVRKFTWRWSGLLQEDMARKELRQHPTQKPLALMAWCLTHAPDGVKTVLDPFMGSGTTLVAVKAKNLKVVGIDQNDQYCKIAADRLRQSVLPLFEE